MSTKRPSVSTISELIQKYQGSDFDIVTQLASRVAALEGVIGSIEDVNTITEAIPLIEEFLSQDNFVTAPLLDNPVDYNAEGFTESTLGALLGAFALLSKINEQDIANNAANLIPAATAQGTSYNPLGGGYDPVFTDVEQVLDSLKSTFTQSGRILLNADQSETFNYLPSAITNVPYVDSGSGHNSTYSVPGKTTFYDFGLDQFNFSQFSNGDILTLRIDLDIAGNATDEVALILSLAEGSPNAISKLITKSYFGTSGALNITGEVTFIIDSLEIITNPAHLQIQSDSSLTISLNSFELFMHTKD